MCALVLSTGARVRPRNLLAPLGVWVVLAVLAVLNGGFRETVLVPRVGEDAGHLLSTALLVAAILAVSGLYFAATDRAYTRRELLLVGATWVVLTVGFEFLVGAVEGTPVEETLAQYDVLAGELWILVPLTLFVAPLVFGALFSRR